MIFEWMDFDRFYAVGSIVGLQGPTDRLEWERERICMANSRQNGFGRWRSRYQQENHRSMPPASVVLGNAIEAYLAISTYRMFSFLLL